MSDFTISPTLNKNKVFILQRSELEKRLDPFYYIPSLVELEKKILAKKPKRLRDYVVSIASGATPNRDEEEKYYSDAENGVPFLRVQNVTEFGLELKDVKYINKKTHEGYLKRSQVFENDLLVTITGRIASSAVAPKGFVGNINQHSVVIKTESREISKMLAAYLNSGMGQKLALRQTTGGTRPALDYPALLSIPIINDKRVLEISKKVIERKKQSEAAAEKLLASIDDYLLKELGISLPTPPENILKNRIYKTTLQEISGKRFDPHFHQEKFKQIDEHLHKSIYPISTLRKKSILISSGATPLSKSNAYTENTLNGIPFIRSGDISDIDFENCIYIKPEIHNSILKSSQLKEGDLLFAIVGATIGEIGIYNFSREANINQAIALVRLNNDVISSFAKEFFKTSIGNSILDRVKRPVARANINLEEIGTLPIPVPPLAKQKKITEQINDIRKQAHQLKEKTKEALIKASKEIEEILLEK